MIPLQSRNSLRLRLLLPVFLGLIATAVGAQDSVSVTEITPKLLVFPPRAVMTSPRLDKTVLCFSEHRRPPVRRRSAPSLQGARNLPLGMS